MILNTYDLEKYAEMRHKETVEAARLEQLIQEIKEQKPRRQKLTGRVGDWLIRLGYLYPFSSDSNNALAHFETTVDHSVPSPTPTPPPTSTGYPVYLPIILR